MKYYSLDSRNADALRRTLTGQRRELGVSFNKATLVGAVEAFLSLVKRDIDDCGDGALLRIPLSNEMASVWTARDSTGPDIHGAPSLEFFRLTSRSDISASSFQLYQERFTRSLQRIGMFEKDFSFGITSVLAEMADNVVQHSSENSEGLTGILGFHVVEGFAAFIVGDIGDGPLIRFRKSALWSHLNSSAEALRAIAIDGASSRDGQGEGAGFRTLFQKLADRNARIRLRAGDAAAEISDARDHRTATMSSSPHLDGFQVSVCCSLKGSPDEKVIENH